MLKSFFKLFLFFAAVSSYAGTYFDVIIDGQSATMAYPYYIDCASFSPPSGVTVVDCWHINPGGGNGPIGLFAIDNQPVSLYNGDDIRFEGDYVASVSDLFTSSEAPDHPVVYVFNDEGAVGIEVLDENTIDFSGGSSRIANVNLEIFNPELNPVSDGYFELNNLEDSDYVQIKIHDIQGRFIQSGKYHEGDVFQIVAEAGVYSVSIYNEDGHNVSLKILKK